MTKNLQKSKRAAVHEVHDTAPCTRKTEPDDQEEPREQEVFSDDELLEQYSIERRMLKRVVFNIPEPSINVNTPKKNHKHCGIEIDDPFEEPEPGLMLIEGSINGIKARILVDACATLIYISTKLCVNCNIHT